MKRKITVINTQAADLVQSMIVWCTTHPDIAKLLRESWEKAKTMGNESDQAREGQRIADYALMEYPEAHKTFGDIIAKHVAVTVEVEDLDGQT